MDHFVKERIMRKSTQIYFLFITKCKWISKVWNGGPHGDRITIVQYYNLKLHLERE